MTVQGSAGHGPEAGFSLVETLVSLAIIAGMTGLLMESISVNAHTAQTLARRREAALLAQSLLAQATTPAAAAQMGQQGRWRALSWRVGRRAVDAGARASGPPLEEVRIDVADADTGKRLVAVRTLRLGR